VSEPPASLRTWAVRLVKIAVVVGALAWLLASGRLDLADLRYERQVWGWVLAGSLLTLAPFFISFYRLFWVLRATEAPLPVLQVLRFGFIGAFFNTFTLGGMGGDVVKVGYLAHASGRAAGVFAAVLLDRVIALLSILSLGGLALLVGFQYVGSEGPLEGLVIVTLLVLGGSAFAGVVGVLAMARGRRAGLLLWLGLCSALVLVLAFGLPDGPWALSNTASRAAMLRGRVALVLGVDALGALVAALLLPACLPGGRLSDFVRHRMPLGEPFMRFVDALLMVRQRLPLMAAMWLLSMFSQSLTIVALWCFAHALPLDVQPSLLQLGTVTPLAMVINTVPVPGGGLGVGEVALAGLLELWRVEGQAITGGATIFLSWRIWVVLWGMLGLPAFLMKGRRERATPES
jgi:uncharacterized membrane protein YbhN (UPF0104 family)